MTPATTAGRTHTWSRDCGTAGSSLVSLLSGLHETLSGEIRRLKLAYLGERLTFAEFSLAGLDVSCS